MRDIALHLQGYMLAGCAVATAALILGCAAAMGMGALRRFRRTGHFAALALMAAWAVVVGGSKPSSVLVRWDEGLTGGGVEVPEDDPHLITFSWGYADWVPETAKVTVSANLIGSANGTFEVGCVSVTNRSLTAYMEADATNYVYFVEQSYIPEQAVVTNGVYHVRCFGGVDVWVPKGLTVYGDGAALSWPDGTPIPAEAVEEEDCIDIVNEGEDQ